MIQNDQKSFNLNKIFKDLRLISKDIPKIDQNTNGNQNSNKSPQIKKTSINKHPTETKLLSQINQLQIELEKERQMRFKAEQQIQRLLSQMNLD